MKTNILNISLALLAATSLGACTADTDAVNMAPEIVTGSTVATTRTSATVSGTVTAQSSTVDEYGIAYSSSSQMYDSKQVRFQEKLNGAKTFNVTIEGLSSGTAYYYRTYAISGGACVYGEYAMFQTPSISAPTIDGVWYSNVMASQATVTAVVSDKGVSEDVDLDLSGAMIKFKRLGDAKWTGDAKNIDKTSADWKSTNAQLVADGDKITVSGTITGLVSSSTYAAYVSAVCAGEGRSSIVTFVTAETSNPELSNVTYSESDGGQSLELTSSVTNPGKTGGSGQATVISRGFVYSTANPTPEIEGSTALPVQGNDNNFTSTLSGLSYSTTYYIRAYAQNENGYGYGSVLEYTTPDVFVMPYIHTVSLTDLTESSVKLIGYISTNGVQISSYGFIFNGERITMQTNPEGTFEYTVTNLSPETKYTFNTFYVDASGIQHFGKEVSFITEPAPPTINDILYPQNK